MGTLVSPLFKVRCRKRSVTDFAGSIITPVPASPSYREWLTHAITFFCLLRVQDKLFPPLCREHLKLELFLGRNTFFHVKCRRCSSSGSREKMKGTSSLFKRQILMFSLRSKRKFGEGGDVEDKPKSTVLGPLKAVPLHS